MDSSASKFCGSVSIPQAEIINMKPKGKLKSRVVALVSIPQAEIINMKLGRYALWGVGRMFQFRKQKSLI